MGIYIVRNGGSKSPNKYVQQSDDELFLSYDFQRYDMPYNYKQNVFERMKEYGKRNNIDIIHACSVQYWDGDTESKVGFILQFSDPKQKLMFKLIYNEEDFKTMS